MENQEPAFPWVPEYEQDLGLSSVNHDFGLEGSALVGITNLLFSLLELYLICFFTYIVTGLLVAQ